MEKVLDARDTIRGSAGECYRTTLDKETGRYIREKIMELIKIEANLKKEKTTVPILGKVGKGNKSTGVTYTGSATMHYISSRFRELLYEYKETGKDFYFDLTVTNEDKTSSVGRQTIILKDCNIDGCVLAKLDADSEYLDEEFDFTFEDWEIPEKFKSLEGME